MALPSSGTISLSMIASEFGGSTPHSLSEYYRGGAYVVNHAGTSNIPTSGQIALSNFYGSWAVVAVTLNSAFQSQIRTAPSNAFARLELYGGIVRGRVTSISGATNNKFTWDNFGASSDYQIRVQLSSGTGPAGSAVNSWLDCNTNPGWHLSQTSIGTTSCSLSVEIRLKSSGSVLAGPVTWTLSVTKSSG